MNRITEITKRDILDLFQNGLEIDEFFQTRTVTYNYYGRLEEIDFLKRLYDLERMPSFDSRFANAEQDIWQHTVNNDDYPYCCFVSWCADQCGYIESGIIPKFAGCVDGAVYTVEGNSGDACRQKQYTVGSSSIYGYGVPAY